MYTTYRIACKKKHLISIIEKFSKKMRSMLTLIRTLNYINGLENFKYAKTKHGVNT